MGLGQRALLHLGQDSEEAGQASEDAGQLSEAAGAGDHLAFRGGAPGRRLGIPTQAAYGCWGWRSEAEDYTWGLSGLQGPGCQWWSPSAMGAAPILLSVVLYLILFSFVIPFGRSPGTFPSISFGPESRIVPPSQP